jgi:hypothetical protein
MSMYRDGKSFSFIANALSRTENEILTQFNLEKARTRSKHAETHHRKHRPERRRRGPTYTVFHDPFGFPTGGPYIYDESDDDEEEDEDSFGLHPDIHFCGGDFR